MKKFLKATAAAVLTVSMAGCSVNAESNAAANTTTKKDDTSTSSTTNTALSYSSDETGKEETVYVFDDASGTRQKVIVSDKLHTGGKTGAVKDFSNLKDIVNVAGDETFTQSSDGNITWDSTGADISYQGTTDEELPVSVKVTYYLNDNEVTPDQIKGASGHVKIHYEYTNNSSETVTVNNKQETIKIPFAMVTGVILPESFTNVEVDNGKCVQYEDNSIVYGIAFPGLKDSLQLSNYDNLDIDLNDIPEDFTIEADTTDFSIDMAMTYASSNLLNDLSTGDIDLSDITSDINELDDAATQLVDGTKTLKDGTSQLKDGANTLASGASQLASGASSAYSGASALSSGLQKLSSNSSTLNDGAQKISQAILDTANSELDQNDLTKDLPDLTLTNYAEVLGGALGKDKLRAAALAQVEQATGQDEATAKALLYMAAIHTTGNVTADLTTQGNRALSAQAVQQATSAYTSKESVLASQKVQAVLAAYKQSLLDNITVPDATDDQMDQVYSQIASTIKSKQSANTAFNALSVLGIDADKAANNLAAQAAEKLTAAGQTPTAESITNALTASISTLQQQMQAAAANPASDTTKQLVANLNSDAYKSNEAYQAFVTSMYEQVYKQQYTQTVSAMDIPALYDQIAAAITQSTGISDEGTIAKLIGYTCDNYDQNKGDLQTQLNAAGSTLTDASSVASEMANATTEEGQEKINGALDVLINSNAQVAEGQEQLNDLEKSLDQLSSFVEGLKTYTAGVDSAYAGSVQLTNGLKTLNDGASQLNDGAKTLYNGVVQLDDGALTLMNGMQQFYDEGIKKITDLFGDDLTDVIDRAKAVLNSGVDYKTYGGALDDDNNTVRFIFKLDAISSDSDNN